MKKRGAVSLIPGPVNGSPNVFFIVIYLILVIRALYSLGGVAPSRSVSIELFVILSGNPFFLTAPLLISLFCPQIIVEFGLSPKESFNGMTNDILSF